MDLAEIAQQTAGKLIGENRVVHHLSIDSRTIKAGDLYLALPGERFDGHDFIDAAIEQGACALIVEREMRNDFPQVRVSRTHDALAKIAEAWRDKLDLKVVGVTGSNGKTTVKEMTAAILGTRSPVLYTSGNFNNDIGVPLTLLRLEEAHRFAVIEMGANHHGEIAYTSRFVKADAVIITNAGPAHLEGFGSVEGVAKAKGEIVETLGEQGIAVLNRDDFYFDYWVRVAGSRKVFSFGFSEQADFCAKNISTGIDSGRFCTRFDLVHEGNAYPINLQLAGLHNVLNALAASAAARAVGVGFIEIIDGLGSLQSVKGRLEALVGDTGNIIIDDSYNANPASLNAGLEVLKSCPGQPWLILGAFGELGEESAQLHAEMGEMAKSKGIAKIYAIGEDARACVRTFGEGAAFFESQEDLINAVKQELIPDAVLLVKGSRAQKMDLVVAALVSDFRK